MRLAHALDVLRPLGDAPRRYRGPRWPQAAAANIMTAPTEQGALQTLEELRCARRTRRHSHAAHRGACAAPPCSACTPPPRPHSFDNLVLRALPVEDGPRTTPRPVSGACFSRAQPAPLDNPVLVAASPDALRLLGLDADVGCGPHRACAMCGTGRALTRSLAARTRKDALGRRNDAPPPAAVS